MEKCRNRTEQRLKGIRKRKLELKGRWPMERIAIPKLPTTENPEVFCYLSRRQVAAIPKDQYLVQRYLFARPIKKGRGREGKMAYIIKLVAEIANTAKEERDAERKKSRRRRIGGGGGTPSNVFHRFIDEDKMSDCMLRIIDSYFHGGEKCTICDVDLNLCDFSLLMHFYFGYINILANNSQLAYCTYLKNKVFSGEEKVGVRNFNIYAKKSIYTKFKNLLEEDKNISFAVRPTPTPGITVQLLQQGKTLLPPFQDIGWKFHYSPYFTELRKERKELENMKL